MRYQYSLTAPSQSEFDSLPRLPFVIQHEHQQLEVIGLVDSGATVNVLPYDIGIQLGVIWDERKATIKLAGNLSHANAMPLAVTAQIADFPPVRFVFAWVKTNTVPLILGQTNFFMECEGCFYRYDLEFEVKPRP